MKETKKYVESRQLHIEGFTRESKVELEDNEKVPSISLTSDKKRDDRNVYTSNLLKKIIHKDNMYEAFKRVKKNKGSHGIDGLTIDELQSYLEVNGLKLKQLTGRSKIGNIKLTYEKIKQLAVGWINYFKLADMKSLMKELDKWLRRRIRMCYWKQWKKIRTKFSNLQKLGISKQKAWEYANTRKGYWRISNSPILSMSITNAKLEKAGLVSLLKIYTARC